MSVSRYNTRAVSINTVVPIKRYESVHRQIAAAQITYRLWPILVWSSICLTISTLSSLNAFLVPIQYKHTWIGIFCCTEMWWWKFEWLNTMTWHCTRKSDTLGWSLKCNRTAVHSINIAITISCMWIKQKRLPPDWISTKNSAPVVTILKRAIDKERASCKPTVPIFASTGIVVIPNNVRKTCTSKLCPYITVE